MKSEFRIFLISLMVVSAISYCLAFGQQRTHPQFQKQAPMLNNNAGAARMNQAVPLARVPSRTAYGRGSVDYPDYGPDFATGGGSLYPASASMPIRQNVAAPGPSQQTGASYYGAPSTGTSYYAPAQTGQQQQQQGQQQQAQAYPPRNYQQLMTSLAQRGYLPPGGATNVNPQLGLGTGLISNAAQQITQQAAGGRQPQQQQQQPMPASYRYPGPAPPPQQVLTHINDNSNKPPQEVLPPVPWLPNNGQIGTAGPPLPEDPNATPKWRYRLLMSTTPEPAPPKTENESGGDPPPVGPPPAAWISMADKRCQCFCSPQVDPAAPSIDLSLFMTTPLPPQVRWQQVGSQVSSSSSSTNNRNNTSQLRQLPPAQPPQRTRARREPPTNFDNFETPPPLRSNLLRFYNACQCWCTEV